MENGVDQHEFWTTSGRALVEGDVETTVSRYGFPCMAMADGFEPVRQRLERLGTIEGSVAGAGRAAAPLGFQPIKADRSRSRSQ